jgi:hypothetical protein
MTNSNSIGSITQSITQKETDSTSPEIREFLRLVQKKGWQSQILGQAPLPTEPVRLGNWLIVPAEQDSSKIPDRALERIQTLFHSGLRPKGFVLVHEAPKLLPFPRGDDTEKDFQIHAFPSNFTTKLKKIGLWIGAALLGIALLTSLALVIAIAIGAALMLLVPAAMVTGAVALDPILVAVTEDNFWIEIDRWDIQIKN